MKLLRDGLSLDHGGHCFLPYLLRQLSAFLSLVPVQCGAHNDTKHTMRIFLPLPFEDNSFLDISPQLIYHQLRFSGNFVRIILEELRIQLEFCILFHVKAKIYRYALHWSCNAFVDKWSIVSIRYTGTKRKSGWLNE